MGKHQYCYYCKKCNRIVRVKFPIPDEDTLEYCKRCRMKGMSKKEIEKFVEDLK